MFYTKNLLSPNCIGSRINWCRNVMNEGQIICRDANLCQLPTLLPSKSINIWSACELLNLITVSQLSPALPAKLFARLQTRPELYNKVSRMEKVSPVTEVVKSSKLAAVAAERKVDCKVTRSAQVGRGGNQVVSAQCEHTGPAEAVNYRVEKYCF